MPDFTSFNIMKQCKKILEKVTALPDTIAAVKTVVDSIKTLVDTNNTASKTGILSQKLSYNIALNKIMGIKQKQQWVEKIGYALLACILFMLCC